MFEIFTIFLYALVLGLFHAFEADHIAAVSSLSVDSKQVSKLGLFWGAGHTLILFIVGTIFLLFKITIPESVSVSLEGVVGVVLLLLGTNVLLKVRKDKIHVHIHSHDGGTHAHFHSHKKTFLHRHEHKSFAIGLLHGLAGSGAIVLLVLATADSLAQGFTFILVFGIGSVFGMTLVSFFLGYLLNRASTFLRGIQYTAGAFSIFIGVIVLLNALSF